jgi:multidrug resistance efflux pump
LFFVIRYNDKYSKDLVVTKKKLGEAEAKIAALEKTLKQAHKERDSAVQTLAQMKTQSAQQDGHARMQIQIMRNEYEELQKKYVFAVFSFLMHVVWRTVGLMLFSMYL